MANYEVITFLVYAYFTGGCFYLSNAFNVEIVKGRAFNFFFRALGFFMIWQTIGLVNAVVAESGGPSSVQQGLQVLYVIAMWVFIVMLFFMFLDIFVWLFKLLAEQKKIGRMKL